MIFKNIIYLLGFFLLLNCKKNTLSEKEVIETNNFIETSDSKLNKVVITGTTDDIVAFKYLNISTETNLTLGKDKDFEKEIIDDSLHIVLNSINKSFFALIQASGKENNFYRGWIFLIPGDTISVKIKDGRMKFYGRNSLYNNFYTDLNKNTPDYNKNPYQGNLMSYKNKVRSIYNKRTVFFQEYIKTNNIKLKLFINTIETNLRHEYLHNLINPTNKKAQFIEGLYFNESDVLYPLLYSEQNENPESIIDLKNYFGKISINEFKNQEALDNSLFFRMNINEYIRYYFLDSKYTPYSKEKFIAEKEFIEKNFEGNIKNFAIKELIRKFHRKGFGNSKLTIDIIKNVINEYEEQFFKPSYVELINKVKEDIDNYNFEISKYALSSKFVNINRDTLTLSEVFNRSNKRIKVVDFWASWCPPCIEQIREGKDFKDKLSVKNNVEWIYISPEKDFEKWINANKKFDHVLNFHNSFFLLKGRSSALSKFFKVDQIPRYIIFDQQNKIILNHAPSPSDEVIFEKIINDLYNDNLIEK